MSCQLEYGAGGSHVTAFKGFWQHIKPAVKLVTPSWIFPEIKTGFQCFLVPILTIYEQSYPLSAILTGST
jgi:hypothetical protein